MSSDISDIAVVPEMATPIDTPSQMMVSFRDPSDVKLHRIKDFILLSIVALLFVSIAMNIYQFVRKPDLIVAVTTPDGQRVVKINNREYGATDAVSVGSDKTSDEDKTYLASQFSKALYAIDPATRQKDLERALRTMVPASAVEYANWLKQSGILELQRRENWQTVWTEQSVKIDSNDRYLVHIIGTQEITKTIGDTIQKETIQLSLDIKLVSDLPRSDRNLRTGFLVGKFKGEELSHTKQSP